MWFKNLQIYRLSLPCPLTRDDLEQALAGAAFSPCLPSARESLGFVPLREHGAFVHSIGEHWFIALQREGKLLPSSVVNQQVRERAREIEAREGRKPGRRELGELREQIDGELLLRAFSVRQTVFAWIDPKRGWLGIDAPGRGKADPVLEALCKAVERLPLALVKTARSPVAAMADWLSGGEAPAGFTIDQDCELKSMLEEKSTVRYVHHNLDGDEIRNHIRAGKQPTRLALTWNDRLSFVLTDKLEIKRIAILDTIKEEAEHNAENADELFDADLALMSGEFTRFLPDLLDALGGESENADPAPAVREVETV